MTPLSLLPAERAASRRRGQLVGLAKAREARLALAERRRLGAEPGWHREGTADWRLSATEANSGAALLERHGWRAEACALGQGIALVEVRDLAVRCHPLVATLRAPGEAERWLQSAATACGGASRRPRTESGHEDARVHVPPQGATCRPGRWPTTRRHSTAGAGPELWPPSQPALVWYDTIVVTRGRAHRMTAVPLDDAQRRARRSAADADATIRTPRDFLPFEEARALVRQRGLKSHDEWRAPWSRSPARPAGIPSDPGSVYKARGWSGWGDWLGTGNVANSNREYRPFPEARAFVHAGPEVTSPRGKSTAGKATSPTTSRPNPSGVYKAAGWVGWGDWLGTGKLHRNRPQVPPLRRGPRLRPCAGSGEPVRVAGLLPVGR